MLVGHRLLGPPMEHLLLQRGLPQDYTKNHVCTSSSDDCPHGADAERKEKERRGSCRQVACDEDTNTTRRKKQADAGIEKRRNYICC
jgi:hypothetical protein